jgi:hypothetical protein
MEDQAVYQTENQPEVLVVAKMIKEKISELEIERSYIRAMSEDKAKAISNHDRSIAIAVAKMRNGVPLSLDGEPIEKMPANLIPYVAKGLCWETCYQMELAENVYRGHLSNIEAIKAELNGLQSINRNLSEV